MTVSENHTTKPTMVGGSESALLLWIGIVAVSALVLVACADAGDDTAPVVPAPVAPSPTTEREADPATTAVATDTDPGGDSEARPLPCDAAHDAFADTEFAFVGTIVAISDEIAPRRDDGEGRSGGSPTTPWVTFEVDGWYTRDQGTTFSVWVPHHAVEIGQRIAGGGDAHYAEVAGFAGQAGTVEFCSPADGTDLVAWDSRFGPPVVAGANTPEGRPRPRALARIDAAQAAWDALELVSYSYVFSSESGPRTSHDCDQRAIRVVVEAGVVVEAIGVGINIGPAAVGCRLDPAQVPTIDELFDRARAASAATRFRFSSDPDLGIVMQFWGSDRSIDVSATVSRLSTSTAPAVSGWDDVRAAATEARASWEATAIDYDITIVDSNCFGCAGTVEATSVDGAAVALTLNGETIDPSELLQPWTPHTVDGLFELLDALDGEGLVVAVFDAATGVPLDLWFDPYPDAIDDESAKSVTIAPR